MNEQRPEDQKETIQDLLTAVQHLTEAVSNLTKTKQLHEFAILDLQRSRTKMQQQIAALKGEDK